MCAALVASTRPEANGVTYSSDSSDSRCFAEFGMSASTGAPSVWLTCMLDRTGGGG